MPLLASPQVVSIFTPAEKPHGLLFHMVPSLTHYPVAAKTTLGIFLNLQTGIFFHIAVCKILKYSCELSHISALPIGMDHQICYYWDYSLFSLSFSVYILVLGAWFPPGFVDLFLLFSHDQ